MLSFETTKKPLDDNSIDTNKIEFHKVTKDPDTDEKNHLVGAFSYNILADRRQCKDFLYVPCSYPQRNQYKYSDTEGEERLNTLDIVRLAADFAYIEESKARKFSFADYSEQKIGLFEK